MSAEVWSVLLPRYPQRSELTGRENEGDTRGTGSTRCGEHVEHLAVTPDLVRQLLRMHGSTVRRGSISVGRPRCLLGLRTCRATPWGVVTARVGRNSPQWPGRSGDCQLCPVRSAKLTSSAVDIVASVCSSGVLSECLGLPLSSRGFWCCCCYSCDSGQDNDDLVARSKVQPWGLCGFFTCGTQASQRYKYTQA